MKNLKIALAVLLLAGSLSAVPGQAQSGGAHVYTWVLDYRFDTDPPQYVLKSCQDPVGYDEVVADWRAKEIIREGLRCFPGGNLYYPAHLVQRVQVYVSPRPQR